MKLYVCGTDWQCEAKDVPHAVKFYKTIDRLKSDKKCWKDCGIVEIDMKMSKVIFESTFRHGVKK